MKRVSPEELQIAERARKFKGEALHSLHHYVRVDFLEESYHMLNKSSSSGVDSISWDAYGKDLIENLENLEDGFKSGRYRAPAIRRVEIPKGKGKTRPLGIPTIEDKVLQRAVKRLLEPIYEEDFKDFSYGFRPNRSAHDAIDYMFKKVSFEGMRYIIDADIQDYFGSISHSMLRNFLDQRVNDGVVRRMIDKWLKAGILDKGQISYPKSGTPQGSVISPLLSNVYLHYVLDEWFSEQIQCRLKGKSFIVRFADDFVLGFTDLSDAERVLAVLPKRFAKYGLTLHPDKTRLIDFYSPRGVTGRSFDFLGFTHFLAKSRKGEIVLKRKTSSKSLRKSVVNIYQFIKRNRHIKINVLINMLNAKLRGHYQYFGITFNFRSLNAFYNLVKFYLRKWLNRRGGMKVWQWERFSLLVNVWSPLLKPFIAKPYLRV
jgi:group II intron reverse transcriptase/maturase